MQKLFHFLVVGAMVSCFDKPSTDDDDDDDEEEDSDEGSNAGECADGQDNDGDGFIDCDDQDCLTKPACNGTDTDTDHNRIAVPTEIDELSAYLYANFNGNGEDGAEALPAAITTLEAYLNTLNLDLSSDVANRSVALSPLTEADLDGTSAPDGINLTDQVSVAVSAQTALTMDQELSMIMDTNQVCITANATAYHAVTIISGGNCFQAGSCDLMETSNEIFIDDIIDGWLDTQKEYRWVTMEDDRKAIVAREWMPEVAESGLSSWDQRFTIVVWIPTADASTTLRYYAMWSSITSILPDGAYTDKVINELNEYYANSVAFINGEDCENDRNRPYDRE